MLQLFLALLVLPLTMREKVSRKAKQVDNKSSTKPKGYKLYNNIGTFVFPIYTFPWRET